MTIDRERWDKIDHVRHFLEAIAGTTDELFPDVKGMRLPGALRVHAMRLLKHYPEEWWVDERRAKP